MNIKFSLIVIVFLLLGVFLFGVFGYSLIEKWSFLDSAYMTVITLSSVGFGEVKPLSGTGQIFTIILIILGMGTVLYGLTTITAAVVEGRINELLRRKKMERNIAALKNHVIVCGPQDTTRSIIEELYQTKTPFVIVDKQAGAWLELMEYKNILYVDGDATEEAILKKAGINQARGLITAQDNDTQNVFVVLTARELNPDLRIISRVSTREAEQKFLRAGANAVVCPNFIGGMRLASEIIRPTVVDFLDVMIRARELTLRIEEVSIGGNSPYVNKTLAESKIGHDTGVIIVAKKDIVTGRYLYNPRADTVIVEGDVLIALGEVEQIDKLKKLSKS